MRKIFFATILSVLIQIAKADDVVVSTTTTISQLCTILGTTNPIADLNGKTLRFERGGSITGTGTIRNGSIDADFNLSGIFSTTLTLTNLTAYNQYFSARWFGAVPTIGTTPGNADNYTYLQRAIDVCMHQPAPIPLYIPPGVYDYSQPLLIANITNPSPVTYGTFSFHMFGETHSWSFRDITTLNFTGTGNKYALGIQDGRGVEVNDLKIIGKYEPPYTTDDIFYLTITGRYTDVNGACTDDYSGIVIDPSASGANGGSIGIKIHDVYVLNFATDFSINPANCTNSQMFVFENIQLGDSKWGFKGGSGQSRGNTVRGLYSTGKMHTLICLGKSASPTAAVGFWTFDKGYVTSRCIRLCDITDPGWYAVKIKDFHCENIGSFGTIYTDAIYGAPGFNTEAPIYIEGCNFDFVPPQIANPQVLVNTSDGFVKFESCTFRYFTTTGPFPTQTLTMNYPSSPPTFDNCTFSGTVTQNTSLFNMN